MGVNEINECDVKIVFPLIVECDVTNPTTDISSDGSITLLINGGTPPYDITWNDGNVGKTLLNLTKQSLIKLSTSNPEASEDSTAK